MSATARRTAGPISPKRGCAPTGFRWTWSATPGSPSVFPGRRSATLRSRRAARDASTWSPTRAPTRQTEYVEVEESARIVLVEPDEGITLTIAPAKIGDNRTEVTIRQFGVPERFLGPEAEA